MSERRPYIVWKKDYLGVVFLRLRGPFQYPTWEPDQGEATPLPRSQAYAHAAVEKGHPLLMDDSFMHMKPYDLGQRLLAKLDEIPPPPSTDRTPWGSVF